MTVDRQTTERRRRKSDSGDAAGSGSDSGQSSGGPPRSPKPPAADQGAVQRLLGGHIADPHSLLGVHPASAGDRKGIVVRAFHPDATGVELLPGEGDPIPMERVEGGLYAAFVPDGTIPYRHRFRFHFEGGGTWERGDPYEFLPTIGDIDLHLFNEGTHRRLWEILGAHPRTIDGVSGVSFAVWAPTARRVSVVGDFCGWDGRQLPMRALGASGVWELFVPDVGPGALYKFELLTQEGLPRVKTDPFAFKMQQAPETASIVVEQGHEWQDTKWMGDRSTRELTKEPMLIYEVHLGSWARIP